jgi:hypothetical protein
VAPGERSANGVTEGVAKFETPLEGNVKFFFSFVVLKAVQNVYFTAESSQFML